jgi:hypothetical protein
MLSKLANGGCSVQGLPKFQFVYRSKKPNVSEQSNAHLLEKGRNDIWAQYIETQKCYFRRFYGLFVLTYYVSSYCVFHGLGEEQETSM